VDERSANASSPICFADGGLVCVDPLPEPFYAAGSDHGSHL